MRPTDAHVLGSWPHRPLLMGFLSSLLPIAATALGTAVAGPVGGAIGGTLGGAISKNAKQIGAGLGGAVGGYLDDRDTRHQQTNARNIANEQYASTFAQQQALGEQANAQRIAAAKTQMDFQERMSNTAHQREIKDLRAAGLNPILSSKYGGSSTPGGALAQIADTHTPAAASAAARARQTLEMNQMAAQTNMLVAQARKTNQETHTSQLENTLLEDRRGQIKETTQNLISTRDKIVTEIHSLEQMTTNNAVREKLLQIEKRIKFLDPKNLASVGADYVAAELGPLLNEGGVDWKKGVMRLISQFLGTTTHAAPQGPPRKLESREISSARIQENSRRRREFDQNQYKRALQRP